MRNGHDPDPEGVPPIAAATPEPTREEGEILGAFYKGASAKLEALEERLQEKAQ